MVDKHRLYGGRKEKASILRIFSNPRKPCFCWGHGPKTLGGSLGLFLCKDDLLIVADNFRGDIHLFSVEKTGANEAETRKMDTLV